MNKRKHLEEVKEVNSNSKPELKVPGRKFLDAINVFGLFDKTSILKVMPFIFFLSGWAMIYIANSYYAERTIRNIDKTEKEIKELRAEFISGKSDLMYRSKLTEVASAIKPYGLSESVVPPKKIIVKTHN